MGLLEREVQLAALASWLREAADEGGRLAFVSGEAGAGKSALVSDFCSALPGDVLVHWGACEPLSVPRPLVPLVDMAPSLDARILELLRRGDRHGVFTATLDLLQFLARRIRSLRVLVVVTHRDERFGPLGTLLGDVVSLGVVRRLSVPP